LFTYIKMEFLSYSPHYLLSKYIHFYWDGSLDNLNEIPIDVSVNAITMQNLLFFPSDVPIRVDNGIHSKMKSATLIGMISKPSSYQLSGKLRIYGVRFKPTGFSKFFNVPASEYTDKAIELKLVLKLEMDELEDKLFNAKNAQMRCAVLDDFFLNKLIYSSETEEDRMLQWILTQLDDLKEKGKIKSILSQLSLSEKQLRRIFHKRTGLLPKTYSKILRFNLAYQLMLKGDNDWFEIITDCGYFDQAHLIRDFKTYTGTTPTMFQSDFKDFDDFHRN